MTKQIISATKVITLALVLSFGLSYVYAWTAPTATPPAGNVPAPINTSATAQTKTGGLTVGGLTTSGTVTAGKVAAGSWVFHPGADNWLRLMTSSGSAFKDIAVGNLWAVGGTSYLGTVTAGSVSVTDVCTTAGKCLSAGGTVAGTVGGTCQGGNSPIYPATSCRSWACGYGYVWTCWGINTCATGWTDRLLGGDPWDQAWVYGCVKN